jgi:hypothetical protein
MDIKIIIQTIKKVIKKEDVVIALDPKVNIPLNIVRKKEI